MRGITEQRNGTGTVKRAALLLAAVLLVTFAGPAMTPSASSADTQKLIEEAKASKEANQEQLEALEQEKAQIAATVNEYAGQLEWLNKLNADQQEQYQQLVEEKEAALRAVDAAYEEYLAAEDRLAEQEAAYEARLQSMYEHRDKPLIQVFLESGNLQGFFTNMEIIRAIADYDQKMVEDLEAARIEAEIQRQNALKKQADAEALVQLKEAEIDELQHQITRSSADLESARAQLAEQEALEDEFLAQGKELESTIQNLQSKYESEKQKEEEERKRREAEERRRLEAAAAAAREKYGQLTWPVPTSRRITSPFQPYGRTDLPGITRPHMGVDIAAPFSTPVVSAADGVVIVTYNPAWQGWYTGGYGYGNYVIVDHGNGLATLYGHLRTCEVQVGDYVLAGDVVGLMGSTGTSTGSHLHFEVRVNGSPVDPLQPQYIGTP